MTRTHHSGSASSGSSCTSSRSDASARSNDTVSTAYSAQSASGKKTHAVGPQRVEQPADTSVEVSPRDSFATYASTVDFEDDEDDDPRSRGPMPRRRHQCYEPDTCPASTHEFARLFPSSRRFMIQHDDTCSDGNLQLRLDTETSQTPSRRTKKVTLFHLRMKNLKEREFSLRRYCRDSGREVASAKKKYIKSTSSTPVNYLPTNASSKRASKRLSTALQNLSLKNGSVPMHRIDSGYASEEDEEEDDKQMEELLRTITSPAEDVISTPTESIRLDFSNYAQVTLNTERNGKGRNYDFEYWGHNYTWRREKHHDDGEVVYSYELYREGSKKRVAVIMPDALGVEEAQWEAKQGGWIPACSMRLLQQDVSDHLGDVIVTTGLLTLTDDCIRRHFHV